MITQIHISSAVQQTNQGKKNKRFILMAKVTNSSNNVTEIDSLTKLNIYMK